MVEVVVGGCGGLGYLFIQFGGVEFGQELRF